MDPVVVGFNATDACERAVRCAGALAARASAKLHVVSVDQPVVPIGGFGWAAPYDSTGYVADMLADRAKKGAALVPEGVEVEIHAELGSPSSEIVRVAHECGASLIVLGAVHHSRLERFFVGSTADRVVRLANVPCLVAAAAACPERILVAADDSAFGRNALEAALRLGGDMGVELRCIHVTTEAPPPAAMVGTFDGGYYEEMLTKQFDEFVQRVREEAGDGLPGIRTVLRIGGIKENILAEAEEWKADLIAVGTHGRGFVGRAILGSISEGLLRESPVSVMVVPGGA